MIYLRKYWLYLVLFSTQCVSLISIKMSFRFNFIFISWYLCTRDNTFIRYRVNCTKPTKCRLHCFNHFNWLAFCISFNDPKLTLFFIWISSCNAIQYIVPMYYIQHCEFAFSNLQFLFILSTYTNNCHCI